MAYLVRLTLLALALLAGQHAQASFPASQAYSYGYIGSGGGYPSLEAWGAAWGPPRSLTFTGCTGVWTNHTSYCNFNNSSGAPITPQQVQRYPAGYACPANATLTGTTCNCNGGYVQDGSACVAEPTEQELLCAALNGHTTYASSSGSLMPGAGSCSAVGCMITYGDTVIRVKNAQGQTVTEGNATITSSPCTYSAETGSVESACPNGDQGQVNGVTVCVPRDDRTNVVETVTQGGSETVEKDENGNPTSTSTSTSTKTTSCTGGTCTTTTTTNYSGTGGTGSSTTSKSESQADFCRDNPKSAQCDDGGKFLGSCSTSFTCTGDAVQCATAKAVNDQLCKLKEVFEMDSTTQAMVESVLNGTWVEDPKANAQQINVGHFSQSNPLGSSCPGDVTVSLSGFSVVLPMSQHCGWLNLIGNLLVAVSLFGATVFVLRGSN